MNQKDPDFGILAGAHVCTNLKPRLALVQVIVTTCMNYTV